MKKYIARNLVVFLLLILMIFNIVLLIVNYRSHFYTVTASVKDNYNGVVIAEDENGKVWKYLGSNIGTVELLIDNKGTQDLEDDVIVRVKR